MSRKRNKAYRPKPIGAPIGKQTRDKLILPAYSALTVLQHSDDADAVESAWHTLTALFNYIYAARTLNRATSCPTQQCLTVMRAIKARHERTQKIRATGPELLALKQGVCWCDDVIGTLRTDLIERAVIQVDDYLQQQGGYA